MLLLILHMKKHNDMGAAMLLAVKRVSGGGTRWPLFCAGIAGVQRQLAEMIFQSHRTTKHELGQKSSLPTPTPKLLMLFFY